jgi:MarR family 2-MHQ and catechol resistance regulon transcriptional repressor
MKKTSKFRIVGSHHLENSGLVRRKRNKADRRFFIVHLTDRGCKLIKNIFPSHARVIVSEFGVLTDSEQDTLGSLCKKLGLGVSGET